MGRWGGLGACTGNAFIPVIALEWLSREAFGHRHDFWKHPEEFPEWLAVLDDGGSRYALLTMKCSSYAAQTLARLLGTTLALPESEEAAAWLHRGRFHSPDAPPPHLHENAPRTPPPLHDTRAMGILAWKNGAYIQSQFAHALLLELP